jgi:gamma-glutamyl:cysteine ligase YbdK (ATP-grasp superfamily)
LGRTQPIDVGYAGVLSLCNSLQANLEVRGNQEAVDTTNAALSIVPILLAVAANARYLCGRDLRYADARMILWEHSHDVRGIEDFLADRPTRVGLPPRYFRDIQDYFDHVASFPNLLPNTEDALSTYIGLLWNDVRIKFIGPNRETGLVEVRPLSIQPSPFEDVACVGMLLGLLRYTLCQAPGLPPFNVLREDRLQAMIHGLDGRLHHQQADGRWVSRPARQVVAEAIDMAEEGLKGIVPVGEITAFLGILRDRLEVETGTPSDQLARLVAMYADHRHRRGEHRLPIFYVRCLGHVRRTVSPRTQRRPSGEPSRVLFPVDR